jgi:hypothetical protein
MVAVETVLFIVDLNGTYHIRRPCDTLSVCTIESKNRVPLNNYSEIRRRKRVNFDHGQNKHAI